MSMTVKDLFGKIGYLPISALSHSQESNGEENRRGMPWDPLFLRSQESVRNPLAA